MIMKYINDPSNLIEEMLDGFVRAYPEKVSRVAERVVRCTKRPRPGKVGVVSGGGSGHQPAFIGYLGEGLLDAVAVGDIFASPGADACLTAIKEADQGNGVLCCIGNYSGDTMNFEVASEMAEAEGIRVETVIVNDDVASSPRDQMDNRRGVAGEVVAWKVAGAAAVKGYDLKALKRVTEAAIFNTRSMGVAHRPCILPTTGEASFSLDDGEMEIGVGHHGEPGIERVGFMQANQITELLTNRVIDDLPFAVGDEVVVLVNGLGATSNLELDICFRKAAQILDSHNIRIHRTYIGEYFTSQEMAGFSVTLVKVDDELCGLIDAACDGVSFVQFGAE